MAKKLKFLNAWSLIWTYIKYIMLEDVCNQCLRQVGTTLGVLPLYEINDCWLFE